MRPSPIAAGEYVPTADHRVVLSCIPWSNFEGYLRLKGDASVPRIAYLDGTLELMTPSRDHERLKSYIGRLIEAYALETDIDLSPYGGWLLKEALAKAGIEPDECYIIGSDQQKDRPDLAIEVIWTSGSLDKLEIYARLQVAEVWTWKAEKVQIHVLRGERYERVGRSEMLPGLDIGALVTFLDRPTALQAVRAFRRWLADQPVSIRPRRRKR